MKRSLDANTVLKKKFTAICIVFFFLSCISCFPVFAQSQKSEADSIFAVSFSDKILDTMESAKKAVVCIQGDRVEPQNYGNFREKDSEDKFGKAFNGLGTGVIIDSRGYIITNYHVIEGIRKLQVKTSDKTEYAGFLIAKDPVSDLAIIKIKGNEPFSTMELGKSSNVRWGQYPVFAIGNPYGYPFTLTHGMISNLDWDVEVNDRLTYSKAMQTTTPINPGNSGGPLLNVQGEMIAINVAVRQEAQCIAFAIPVDQVVEVAAKMILQECGRIAYHGMRIKFSRESNELLVASVDPESPAEKAGIQEGDVLLACNEVDLKKPLDFSLSLLELKSNDALNLVFLRNGEKIESHLVLSTIPKRRTNLGAVATNNPKQGGNQESAVLSGPTAKYGSSAARKTEELTWRRFGVRYSVVPLNEYKRMFAQYPHYLSDYPDGAIRITSVRANGPMHRAGMETGDIVFAINGWIAAEDSDILAILSALQEGGKTKTVEIQFNRTRANGNDPPNTWYSTDMEI